TTAITPAFSTAPGRPRWLPIAVLATIPLAIFAIAIALALHFGRLPQASPALLAALAWTSTGGIALLLAAWQAPIRSILAGLLLTAPAALDLASNNGPNGASALPSATLEMLNPATSNETIRILKSAAAAATTQTTRPRVELAGLGFHWPNASLPHRLEHTLGYNPVRLKSYARAVGAGDTVGLPDQRVFTRLFPSYKSQLANLLGLRFIATGIPIEKLDKSLAPGAFKLIARTREAYIYENPGAFPRVLFATSAKSANFASIIKTGTWPKADLRTTVLLNAHHVGKQRHPGQARIVKYTNTAVELEATSPDGGWVVLNDIWHPWWRAEVNAVATPIEPANVLFRAIKVPPGRASIRLIFRPISGALADLLHRCAKPGMPNRTETRKGQPPQ
ncbi:MAG TPA: hypothetical protein VMX97_03150, partial [Hyphomicrobiaceae bacterium]|nr:hypothetical protein [Hyphomicrobiaceae bacterium]